MRVCGKYFPPEFFFYSCHSLDLEKISVKPAKDFPALPESIGESFAAQSNGCSQAAGLGAIVH
jgi:hypothetical protein